MRCTVCADTEGAGKLQGSCTSASLSSTSRKPTSPPLSSGRTGSSATDAGKGSVHSVGRMKVVLKPWPARKPKNALHALDNDHAGQHFMHACLSCGSMRHDRQVHAATCACRAAERVLQKRDGCKDACSPGCMAYSASLSSRSARYLSCNSRSAFSWVGASSGRACASGHMLTVRAS